MVNSSTSSFDVYKEQQVGVKMLQVFKKQNSASYSSIT